MTAEKSWERSSLFTFTLFVWADALFRLAACNSHPAAPSPAGPDTVAAAPAGAGVTPAGHLPGLSQARGVEPGISDTATTSMKAT